MTGPWGSLSQRTQDLGSLHGNGSVSVKFTQRQPQELISVEASVVPASSEAYLRPRGRSTVCGILCCVLWERDPHRRFHMPNVLPIVNSQSNSYLRDMTEYGDLNRRGDVLFVTDKVLEKIKAKDDAHAHSQSSKDSRQQDLLLYCLCGGPR